MDAPPSCEMLASRMNGTGRRRTYIVSNGEQHKCSYDIVFLSRGFVRHRANPRKVHYEKGLKSVAQQ